MRSDKKPPRLAKRLLSGFLKEELAEEVLGDLEEGFYRQLGRSGLFRARMGYWYQTVNYLRPFALKTILSQPLNPFSMWLHHFKISIRRFRRDKISFLINTLGLSTALACSLLVYLWIMDEWRVDRFHANQPHLYQVMQNIPTPRGIFTVDGGPGILAPALLEEIPEIEKAATATRYLNRQGSKGLIKANAGAMKAGELYVDEHFLELFSFPVRYGNEERLAAEKNAVLISESLARKLFEEPEKAVGESVTWDRENLSGQFVVVGVFEDVPANSTLQFDCLFSYQYFLDNYPSFQGWANSGPNAYVLLREDAELEAINHKIEDFVRDKYAETIGTDYLENVGTLFLQRYSDRHLYNHFENGVQAGGWIDYLRLFALIGIFILIIAGINFMNLSTAQAWKQLKMIGVKKIVGAHRRHIFGQYLQESFLICLFSFIVSLGLVALILPKFNLLTGKELTLELSPGLILGIIAIVILTGFIAGSYPAFYLSRLRPVEVLKKKIFSGSNNFNPRKGLVVFQFTISVLLIVGVIVVFKQLEWVQTKKLGFEREQTIHFKPEGPLLNAIPRFLEEAGKVPGVRGISVASHNLMDQMMSTAALSWDGKSADEQIQFENFTVGKGFIEMFGIELLAGRTFAPEQFADTAALIFNESAIRAMGLKDPIGKTIQLFGEPHQLIGVVKDFHFAPLYQNIKPLFLRYCPPETAGYLFVKMKPAQEQPVLTELNDLHAAYNQDLTFDYSFLDESYRAIYASERRIASISGYFAALAILISCLGLFGLAVFATARRRREIGIRKVLGAGVSSIVSLLAADFSRMVLIAVLLALPLSYWLAGRWLENYAYRIELEWWIFAGAGLFAFFLAWVTVGFYTLRAARVNPARTLRSE